jgi:RNA polymerase sigma-70 factor (ECF subfamily)
MLLDPNAVAHCGDDQSAQPSHHPVHGAEEVANLLETLASSAITVIDRLVDGRPGLVFVGSDAVLAIASIAVRKRQVVAVWITRDPQKLRTWTARFGAG